jgi:hypothetical protein
LHPCARPKLMVTEKETSLRTVHLFNPTAKLWHVFAELFQKGMAADAIEGVIEINIKNYLVCIVRVPVGPLP